MQTSRCYDCGAEIIWVKTMIGRRHPLDAEADPFGEWVIMPRQDRDGMSRMMVHAGPLHRGQPRYTSHRDTCPYARRRRR